MPSGSLYALSCSLTFFATSLFNCCIQPTHYFLISISLDPK
eukprot:Gb_34994 [translate_table: standard]